MERRLLVAAHTTGTFSHYELLTLKKKAWKSCIGYLITDVSQSKLGQSVMLFDCYRVEELGFFKRLRHYFRVFTATVARYVGVSTVFVVVK